MDMGRLLFVMDDFQPSSAFNSAHVASLSESGVSRDTVENQLIYSFAINLTSIYKVYTYVASAKMV